MRTVGFISWLTAAAVAMTLISCGDKELVVAEGARHQFKGDYTNFVLSGEFQTEPGSSACVAFHDDGTGSGYQVLLHGGPIDGTIKSGSLLHVRNLYRALEEEGEWTPLEVAVRGKNISVKIKGVDVVCYTEPAEPWRLPQYEKMRLGHGAVSLVGGKGTVRFKDMKLTKLPADALNPCDTLPPVDETTDKAIKLQQEDFPVIDWHVHLKGGLTAEMAHAMSMNYGINYGVAPNAGAGGVGRMLANDQEVYEYYDEVKDLPFLRGVQGEGRKWTSDFSSVAMGTFDYLFTDAMTIVDLKGRISRIYRDEEVRPDGLSDQKYMDLIVDQTVKILTNEPADIFANAFFLPAFLNDRFDQMWTPERVAKVLDVMQENGIALEISARYKIPNEYIIREAKKRGIKFTFGTNNVDADFGRLEHSIDVARECGLTAEDMWFPNLSTRAFRPTVIYNHFEGDKIVLFNGKDLSGWVSLIESASDEPVFKVEDGCIVVSGKPNGYLRTVSQYGDYSLHVEWKWIGAGTNSGIFQRVQNDMIWPTAYECQLMAGRAGDIVSLGGARIKEVPYDPEVKFPMKKRIHTGAAIELPDGEWNRAEIICKGDKMMVYINGSLENEATLAYKTGYIALQSEGGPLAFRNIYIE